MGAGRQVAEEKAGVGISMTGERARGTRGELRGRSRVPAPTQNRLIFGPKLAGSMVWLSTPIMANNRANPHVRYSTPMPLTRP